MLVSYFCIIARIFISTLNNVNNNNNKNIYSNSIGQASIQTYNTQSSQYSKQIFLNIYHFPSTLLVLLKYPDPFVESIFESCSLPAFLFELRISALFVNL